MMITYTAQRRLRRGAIALLASLCCVAPQARASLGASARVDTTRITITAPLAWLRQGPSLIAGNSIPVRAGEFYDLLARSADNRWWQLRVPGAGARGTWLPADLGALYSGKLEAQPALPSLAAPAPAAAKPGKKKPAPFPAWIPVFTAQQRAVYQKAASSGVGRDADRFTVVGDCNSQPPVYVRRVATGEYDTSRIEPRLQATVLKFAPSFGRISIAARGGFGTEAMSDPSWADPTLCDPGVGPFACEVWVSRASVVFIELGTGDQFGWQDFETHYKPLVRHALRVGVLPILVTKSDDIEVAGGAPSGHINGVIRRLAREMQVPLMDFDLATRALPNHGLLDEGDKDFHLNDAGIQRHIEATLQTLTALLAPPGQ